MNTTVKTEIGEGEEEAQVGMGRRVPSAYLTSAILAILPNQAIRKINNLCGLNGPLLLDSRRLHRYILLIIK